MPSHEGRDEPAPLKHLSSVSGDVPLWALTFDREGHITSPATRDALLAEIVAGKYSDVVVLCHGWNNDFGRALGWYEEFFSGYLATASEYGATRKSLFLGLFWPSTALVLPWEQAPNLAGTRFPTAVERQELTALAELAVDGPRLTELSTRSVPLSPAEQRELADLVSSTLRGEDEVGISLGQSGEELLAAVAGPTHSYDEGGDFGTVDNGVPGPGDPEAAFLGLGSARKLVRLATVRVMKDRAGVVGATGVAEVLSSLAGTDGAALHLVGHSYGAKVLLAALAAVEGITPVRSLLLLQAAVSQMCFAGDVGTGRSGAYRVCFDRVESPILATFSSRDLALRRLYHWALRRRSDLGEARAAALGQSRFSALGGYGPAGCGTRCQDVPMRRPGETYFPAGHQGIRVLGLDGSDGAIGGHGDISSPATWWALQDLVMGVG